MDPINKTVNYTTSSNQPTPFPVIERPYDFYTILELLIRSQAEVDKQTASALCCLSNKYKITLKDYPTAKFELDVIELILKIPKIERPFRSIPSILIDTQYQELNNWYRARNNICSLWKALANSLDNELPILIYDHNIDNPLQNNINSIQTLFLDWFDKNKEDIAIEQLDLSNQNLSELPSQISELKCITTLDVSSNKLTNIPENLRKLSKLKTLNVSSNKLTSLPDIFRTSYDLDSLDISNNSIVELPTSIYNANFLRILNISHNPINSLDLRLANLACLAILKISKDQKRLKKSFSDTNFYVKVTN